MAIRLGKRKRKVEPTFIWRGLLIRANPPESDYAIRQDPWRVVIFNCLELQAGPGMLKENTEISDCVFERDESLAEGQIVIEAF
jgi:hypothetical protein